MLKDNLLISLKISIVMTILSPFMGRIKFSGFDSERVLLQSLIQLFRIFIIIFVISFTINIIFSIVMKKLDSKKK